MWNLFRRTLTLLGGFSFFFFTGCNFSFSWFRLILRNCSWILKSSKQTMKSRQDVHGANYTGDNFSRARLRLQMACVSKLWFLGDFTIRFLRTQTNLRDFFPMISRKTNRTEITTSLYTRFKTTTCARQKLQWQSATEITRMCKLRASFNVYEILLSLRLYFLFSRITFHFKFSRTYHFIL